MVDPLHNNQDEGGFVHLYMQYESQIRGYILCSIPHWVDAEDVLQETVSILWKKYRAQKFHDHFLALALRVAYLEIRTYYRKQNKNLPLFSPEVLEGIQAKTFQSVQQEDQRKSALLDCVRRLKESDRELITLRYELDSSVKHVADKLGRKTTTIYKALSRVHYKLLQCVRFKLNQEQVV